VHGVQASNLQDLNCTALEKDNDPHQKDNAPHKEDAGILPVPALPVIYPDKKQSKASNNASMHTPIMDT
jgi:hypothetical protein